MNPTLSSRAPDETVETDETYSTVSNDEFLSAIFGNDFKLSRPLVCSLDGDPEGQGWPAKPWPCDTSDDSMNWYAQPSVFSPNDQGRYRAQKTLAGLVYCAMVDDLGTKVPLDRLAACPPSWLIETSPGNYQAGFIFNEPVERKQADALKESLIASGLCDTGATGGSARWMRLPVAINGKAKYATPGPTKCSLAAWHPDRRYSIDDIVDRLELLPVAPAGTRKRAAPGRKAEAIDRNADGVYIPRPDENEVLATLKKRGLYKTPLGSGKHDITCPWVHEHTDQVDHGTAYFEPSDLFPVGGFKCQHGHGGQPKRIGALLEFLGVSFQAAKHRPTIKVEAGELHRVVDAAENVLAESKRYYQRGGLIVSVNTDPTCGETAIKPVSQPALVRALSGCASWLRYDARAEDFVTSDPPARHVQVLFDAQAYSHLPALAGIARQPHLRDDGTVVRDAGFDAPTGLFGVFDARRFQVPDRPSRAQAHGALAELRALLAEFAFASASDEAAALAAMLTATIRPSLPTAPLFHIRAPQIASGKSYLSGIVAAFAGPGTPSAVAFPSSEEECQKLLLASMLEGPSVITFDNLTTDLIPFKSLCSALTEEFLTGRILGVSKVATVGTRTMFLSSGNNVDAVRDMARRCITIALDPQVETPATRQFSGDPLAQVRGDRERFVSLALTIIRAWLAAGSPATVCKPLASYGQWSTWVRQPLLWLGLPDPVARVFEQLAQDPDRETLGRLLQAWRGKFGSAPTMIREAVSAAEAHFTDDAKALRESLLEVADERGEINRRRLGRWIARHQGRIVDGQRFERASGTTSAERWAVKSVMSVSQFSFSQPAESVNAEQNAPEAEDAEVF